MKQVIALGIFYISLVSCNPGLAPSEYIGYVKSSSYPYRKSKQVEDKKFTLIYLPNEYIALQNSGSNGEYNISRYQKELESIQGFMYFIFSIEGMDGNDPLTGNVSDVSSYNSEMDYFMNDIQYDFKLKAGNAIYQCVFSGFENNHGLTNKTSSQLVFERPSSMENIKVIYEDKVFNMGPLVFEFDQIKNKKVKI